MDLLFGSAQGSGNITIISQGTFHNSCSSTTTNSMVPHSQYSYSISWAPAPRRVDCTQPPATADPRRRAFGSFAVELRLAMALSTGTEYRSYLYVCPNLCLYLYLHIWDPGQNQRFVTRPSHTLATYPVTKSMQQAGPGATNPSLAVLSHLRAARQTATKCM